MRVSVGGLTVLVLLVLQVMYPSLFYVIPPIVLGVFGLGTYFCTASSVRRSDTIRGMYALGIPGMLTLFFVDMIFWQYVGAVLLALMTMYYWKRISMHPYTWGSAGILLPVAQASLACVAMLGAMVFLNSPWWASGIGVVVLVLVFPGSFRSRVVIPAHVAHETPRLFTTAAITPYILLWHVVPSHAHAHAHRFMRISLLKDRSVHVLRLKIMGVIAIVQVYLVVAILPVSIVVSAAVIMLAITCLVLLMNYHDYGLMRGAIIKQYISACIAMIIVLLLTAQLT